MQSVVPTCKWSSLYPSLPPPLQLLTERTEKKAIQRAGELKRGALQAEKVLVRAVMAEVAAAQELSMAERAAK